MNFGKIHGACCGVFFIIAISGNGTSAVIPENELIAVRGIVFAAELNETRKSGGVRHGAVAVVTNQLTQTAILYLPYLTDAGADSVILPFRCASGVDDEIQLIAWFSRDHFLKIAGCHAVSRFKVRAAHVYHDGHRIRAVALLFCELVTRPGGDFGVQGSGVGCALRPGWRGSCHGRIRVKPQKLREIGASGVVGSIEICLSGSGVSGPIIVGVRVISEAGTGVIGEETIRAAIDDEDHNDEQNYQEKIAGAAASASPAGPHAGQAAPTFARSAARKSVISGVPSSAAASSNRPGAYA